MRRDLDENHFFSALRAGQPQIGLWSTLCNPVSVELVAYSGFDWLLFDSEHSPVEISGLLQLMQAASSGTAAAVVRVAWNDSVLIKRALDIGAQSLLIPFVQNAQEAQAAVAACHYPPEGIRGVSGVTRATRFGRVAGYPCKAGKEICVLVQLETITALEHLEDIAATPGLAGLFIGPADLAASMGFLGRPDAPEVQKVLYESVKRIKAAGLPAGILATNPADANRYLEWGYTFVAAGVDASLLAQAADALRGKVGSHRGEA